MLSKLVWGVLRLFVLCIEYIYTAGYLGTLHKSMAVSHKGIKPATSRLQAPRYSPILISARLLSPGPGEQQGVLGSSLLVLESRRVCWAPHSWWWRAAGCAGVLTPGLGEPQGVLGSSLLVLESRRVCWGPHSWCWRASVLFSAQYQ